MHWLSVGRRLHRRPVDPHTGRSLHLCTQSRSSEVLRVKGPPQPAQVWDHGGIDARLVNTRSIFCSIDTQCQAVFL